MNPCPQWSSLKTKKWKYYVENLLLKTQICGVCLYEEPELEHWDTSLYIAAEQTKLFIKDIICITFGSHITSLLPTPYLCNECIASILQSYYIIRKIKSNNLIIRNYENVILQQINCYMQTEQPQEKGLLLTIDNTVSLNVPTRVTKPVKKIFLCNVDDIDKLETDFYHADPSLKYECPYCGRQFQSYAQFKTHYSLHNDAYLKCRICLRRYKLFEQMVNHREDTHLELILTCDTCEIILLSSESMEHVTDHAVQKICQSCQIVFKTKSDLEDHNLNMHPDFRLIQCTKCLQYYTEDLKSEGHNCPFSCTECIQLPCIHERFLKSYGELCKNIKRKILFKCPECPFEYINKSEIIDHANIFHLFQTPYLCEQCGDNFESPSALDGHINECVIATNKTEDSTETSYICEFCGIQNDTAIAYESHIKCRRDNKSVCEICGIPLCTTIQKNVHFQSSHMGEYIASRKRDNYVCSICSLGFSIRKKRAFLAHFASHPKESTHICKKCYQSFQSIERYFQHSKRHENKYRVCPICFKRFTRLSIFEHVEQHWTDGPKNEEAPLVCDLCGEHFQHPENLIIHLNKHEEETECSHCYRNVKRSYFSKHMQTHNQEQPWNSPQTCTKCDYSTSFNYCMVAHWRDHHSKNRPIRCDVCDKTFLSESSLKCHKITHKDPLPKHFCNICGDIFLTQESVISHLRSHTDEERYRCDMCGLSFISLNRKHEHERRKHFDPTEVCAKPQESATGLHTHARSH